MTTLEDRVLDHLRQTKGEWLFDKRLLPFATKKPRGILRRKDPLFKDSLVCPLESMDRELYCRLPRRLTKLWWWFFIRSKKRLWKQCVRIMEASDHSTKHDPILRRRMLEAAGLEERS